MGGVIMVLMATTTEAGLRRVFGRRKSSRVVRSAKPRHKDGHKRSPHEGSVAAVVVDTNGDQSVDVLQGRFVLTGYGWRSYRPR